MNLENLDFEGMHQDAVWPMMQRVRPDRKTLVLPERGCVLRRFESEHDAMSYALHGYYLAQRGWSKPCEYIGKEWTAQEHVVAGDAQPNVAGIVRIIAELHGHVGQYGAPRDYTQEELQRVCDREVRNHGGELVETFAKHWPSELRSVRGPWHGDPTLTNCIVDAAGRYWMIDHAPQLLGPQEYDYAKLRRCLLINDEGVIDWQQVARGHDDTWLRVVIAGMLGSHTGEMREKLKEVWECMTT